MFHLSLFTVAQTAPRQVTISETANCGARFQQS